MSALTATEKLTIRAIVYLVCFLGFNTYLIQHRQVPKREFEKRFYEKIVKCGDTLYTKSNKAKEYYKISRITVDSLRYSRGEDKFSSLFTNAGWYVCIETSFHLNASCHFPKCEGTGQSNKDSRNYMLCYLDHEAGGESIKFTSGYHSRGEYNRHIFLEELERPTCEDVAKQSYFEF